MHSQTSAVSGTFRISSVFSFRQNGGFWYILALKFITKALFEVKELFEKAVEKLIEISASFHGFASFCIVSEDASQALVKSTSSLQQPW